MRAKEKDYTVGVIVARFQVPALHEAHIELIQSIIDKHPKTLIFLGLAPVKGTINNPLDYQPRRQMIMEAFPPQKYPNLSIGYIKDITDDDLWSRRLDELISNEIQPNDTVCLYGGRNSFITHYTGRFPTQELVSDTIVSGTEIRNQVAKVPQSHQFFRAGAIWATFQRYPSVYPTVDVFPYDARESRVLLIKKENENNYRLAGGFTSPTDDSYELAAVRELHEETGLEVGPDGLRYIGSAKIDDWRYRSEVDKIITHLYISLNARGPVTAGDDAAQVKWFKLEYIEDLLEIKNLHLVKEHRDLVQKFEEKIIDTLKLKNDPKASKRLKISVIDDEKLYADD